MKPQSPDHDGRGKKVREKNKEVFRTMSGDVRPSVKYVGAFVCLYIYIDKVSLILFCVADTF